MTKFLRNFLIWEFQSPPPPPCYCCPSFQEQVKVVQCNVMKFTNNLMHCVHLEDTKTLWENQNSPWWSAKEHYVDVKSMFMLDGWPSFVPFIIISLYNFLV
jgi:hypothetical protein